MEKIVVEFYNCIFENRINKNMLDYSYSFPEKEVNEYIVRLVSEPIESFINYVETKEREQIKSADVFQFSSLENATDIYCSKLKAINDPGMKYLDIGKLLLDDGKNREDGAYVKYGENHAKTATMLGLSYELCGTYFLSCIGYVYSILEPDVKNKLTTRLILRNKLIVRLWQASLNGNVNVRDFLYMLSDATYVRRRSNVKRILNLLLQSDEYDFTIFYDKLFF